MSRPDAVRAVSALGEPSRRILYDYVARTGDWVSRDDAAAAVGVERGTAAHHLDRLVADGLLEIDYQRLTGRSGPGAGRPAKMYRRVDRDIGVTLPPRDYRLVAGLLARAVDHEEAARTGIDAAVERVAREEGEQWGDVVTSRLRGAGTRRAATRRNAILDLLEEQGYEPETRPDGTVLLRNCPFDQLATDHTDLVCGMNHHLLAAVVERVGRTGVRASLEPSTDHCCVVLRAK